MKRNKSGISLIVLVITIIVMIILAGSVVITLSNSGIIDKANEAVSASDLNQVQHAATLIWVDAYLDGEENLNEQYIRGELAKDGINADKYDIEVTKGGVKVTLSSIPADWKASVREVTEDGEPIPIGFVKSPYANEGTKNTGLVIYALTEDEINKGTTTITDSHQTALETRNQFVWVPVDSNNFETLFKRTAFKGETLSPTLRTNYWELVLDANNMPSQNTTNDNISSYVSSRTLQEATAMYASVKKYGGFYIARYEVGASTTFEDSSYGHIATRATKDNISNLSITMGKYPYSAVAWGTSMADETSNNGAVSLARAFYPSDSTTYGVVSTLTYGVQWDRTLAWWKELNSNIDLTDSTEYGVYYDTIISADDLNEGAQYSFCDVNTYVFYEYVAATARDTGTYWLMTTGAYKKANVYNIYDMAGNLYEWTMEGCSTFSRVFRGGYFGLNGDDGPVAYRYSYYPVFASYPYGFRPSLYIK